MFDLSAGSCFHSGHPRSGQIIIGRKQSSRIGSQPAEFRPRDVGKALLSSNTSQRKPIPKAAVCHSRTEELITAKW